MLPVSIEAFDRLSECVGTNHLYRLLESMAYWVEPSLVES